eukprot:SAG25_NODE_2723_length_1421_cov_4.157337_1_plen_79_part_00
MLHYATVVCCALCCQSTALVVSAVAQTLAVGANSEPRTSGAGVSGTSYELHVAVANKKTTPYDTTPLGVLRYNTTPSS